MRKLGFLFCLCVPLLVVAGCAQVGNLAATDLSNAAQVAIQGGDPQGAACWVALTPIADAIETSPTPDLASVIEADRLFCGCDARTKCTLQRGGWLDFIDALAQSSAALALKAANQLVVL